MRERGIDPLENSWHLPPRPLPNLGKVASKRLRQEHFDQFWVEGIHQNVIFVGQSQPSANSRAKARQKWRQSRQPKASRSRGSDWWAGAARGSDWW